MSISARIRLTVHPSGGDEKEVSAADFIRQADALRKLVSLSAGALSDEIDARIVDLSHSSPATIEMEAVRSGDATVDLVPYFADVSEVIARGGTPERLTRGVFDALKDFSSVIGKGVSRSTLSVGGQTVEVGAKERAQIESAIGKDFVSEGTVDGMLEAVNLHGNVRRLVLYPVVGPSRLPGTFPESLLEDIRPALGKHVLVSGEMKYRWREKYPYEARFNRIVEVYEDDQPQFADILGMAPNATRGAPSEDFVREMRIGWR